MDDELIETCTQCSTDIAGDLLGQGDDSCFPNKHGTTPLHVLSSNGCIPLAKIFIRDDVDLNINVKDKFGSTPLHIAAARCNPTMVKLLLESKANKYAKNDAGLTPLDMANRSDCYEVIDMLSTTK